MCGFAGFFDPEESLREEKYLWMALARRMAQRIAHRGPDEKGAYVSEHCALAQARLAVLDPVKGVQPMTYADSALTAAIVYNGEIYNADALREELSQHGFTFQTGCDTEVVLKSYLCFGPACAEKLNGIFAFAIDDVSNNRLFLCRDRFGVKPLFYTFSGGRLVFASEIKALFEYPGVQPVLGRTGICEVFGIGPTRTPGCGVFENIREIRPGHAAIWGQNGFSEYPYFQLEARPYTEDYDTSVRKVRELLEDIVSRQLTSDVPLCAFLSGDLQSSVIAAIAARERFTRGLPLQTYAFTYGENGQYTGSNSKRTEDSAFWAEQAGALLNTEHSTLICGDEQFPDLLMDAVIARDLPGMADIDAAFLCFCREVKKRHTVALCGECADEIFGGHPWFFQKSPAGVFPWSRNLSQRASLLKPDIAAEIQLEDYVRERFREAVDAVPVLCGESSENRQFRTMTFLSLYWFMATLLEQKDRCGMYSGLEVRVPYADHRLIEYIFNTPKEIRAPNGVPDGLLRDACRGLLPDSVLFRPKCPFPKIHNPRYTEELRKRLSHVLRDTEQPIHRLLSAKAAVDLLHQCLDDRHPWFGPFLSGPQRIAYLLQINLWLVRYKIKIVL